MKRLLITISYDGTNYHGWQVQPNAITIQETVQNSLEKLLGSRPEITGCSRTDAGVHAKEFCFHLDCDEKYPIETFLKGLNSVLPDDISVIDCKLVDNTFHARYNSIGKTYVYRIYNSNIKDPFLLRYSWQIERKLDINKINMFCKEIIGTYDFKAFSSSGLSVTDTVRTIKDCKAVKNDNIINIYITADGFLYNMVRIIVGTAIEVSDGKINNTEIKNILRSKDRSKAGITAPAKGLFLQKVLY